MSNLVKQQFVLQESSTTRIINSNNKAEEFLRKNLVTGETVQEPDSFEDEGFSQGIYGEEISLDTEAMQAENQEVLDPEPVMEELIANANEEANQIIENANEEANRIIEDANQQVESLFASEKQRGYEEGLAAGSEELENQRAALQQEYEEYQAKTEAEYQELRTTMEADIVEAVIEVFDKVFRIQFDDKKELLLSLVRNTLRNMETGKDIKVRVSEGNRKFFESKIGEIQKEVGSEHQIEVLIDATMGETDCMIETDFGVFDCGIDMELSNLYKDIRSLCE